MDKKVLNVILYSIKIVIKLKKFSKVRNKKLIK